MEKSRLGLNRWFVARWRKPLDGMLVAAIMSIYTLVAFHVPLFSAVVAATEGGWHMALILCSFIILLLVANFMIYGIMLYAMRMVGRVLISLFMLGNAIALYFINSYEVLLTREMMGNLFNTQYSEASSYFSIGAVLYTLLLGVIPSVWLLCRKVNYGKVRRFAVSMLCSILAIITLALVNMGSVLWIDRNAPVIGSLILPWSYVVNSVRYASQQCAAGREAVLLPDVDSISASRDVVVLVIGESARSANFSLYGYERTTNPLLESDGVTIFEASASATYTTAGVEAILSHAPSDELYESLPSYLSRAGVYVSWRTTNWGEPSLKVDSYLKAQDIKDRYADADMSYDGILLAGLDEEIAASEADKLLIVLHTSTSHGPTYYKKYPSEFEVFSPVCTTVEMSKADHESLVNAYDNTILYTDYLLHSVIEVLRGVEDRRCAMIYVSDHGESLGEGGLYMHGMPLALAPSEQIEIPFIVWTSEDVTYSPVDSVGHYHVFHSVLGFMGISTPIYNSSNDIFMTVGTENDVVK